MQRDIERIKNEQNDRPMTPAERDQLLVGSVVVIGSITMWKLLTGEATWPQECSGGFVANPNDSMLYCNGLAVRPY